MDAPQILLMEPDEWKRPDLEVASAIARKLQLAARKRQAPERLMLVASFLLLPPILALALGWAGIWIMRGFHR